MRFVFLAGLMAASLVVACDRATELLEPTRQSTVAVGNSIFLRAGDDQIGLGGTRLPKSLSVIVRNAGSPVANARGTLSVTSGGGSVARGYFYTNTNGVATFLWTLGASGPQTLTATVDGGNSVVFSAHAVPAGSTLTIVGGDGQSGVPGDSLVRTISVKLTDPLGAVIPGVPVRFATPAAHGGATRYLVRATNSFGISGNRWMLGWGATSQRLTAFVPGVDVDTVVFNATTSNEGVSFTVVSGGNQTGNPGSPLSNPVVVQLKKRGIPVPMVRGSFSIGSGGGLLNRRTFTTNSSGAASVIWTPGTTAVTQQLTADIGGIAASAASATANQGTFITNTSRSKSLIMSRHNTAERQFNVSYRVSSTVHLMGVYVFVTQNGSQLIGGNGIPPQNVYCMGQYNIGAGIHDETCTITVPHKAGTGDYDLQFIAGADTVVMSDTLGISLDDTNPLTMGSVSLSHNTVQSSNPATHMVTAQLAGASSQGMEYMDANIYQTEGIYLSNGCVAYQAPAGTLTSVAASCSLYFNKAPGTYNIRYAVYDHAGNIIYHHVIGAVTVVP